MIVTYVTDLGRRATSMGDILSLCVARRGMLHSECEGMDYLELPPQGTVTMDGRSGTEEGWYVLDGSAEFSDLTTGQLHHVPTGHLALRPFGTESVVRNPSWDTPLRVLLIAVLPREVSDRLPRRSPVVEDHPHQTQSPTTPRPPNTPGVPSQA